MRFFEFLFHFLEDVIDTLAKQNSRPLWVKTSTLSIVSLQQKSSPWGNNKRDNSLQHKKCGEKQEEARTFSHSIGKYLWKNCHHSIAKENDQSVFSLLNVLRLQTRSLLSVFYLEFCYALNSITFTVRIWYSAFLTAWLYAVWITGHFSAIACYESQ